MPSFNIFLYKVVFPREVKQFSKRLAASAWDLAEKNRVVTWFSGNKWAEICSPYLLNNVILWNSWERTPKVFGYHLRPENDHYVRPFREVHLIGSHNILEQLVSRNPVGVLFDVGAQTLDMQSTEIVSVWLCRMELDISRRILERYYYMGACWHEDFVIILPLYYGWSSSPLFQWIEVGNRWRCTEKFL